MLIQEVHRKRLELGTVLHRKSPESRRQRSCHLTLATGTELYLQAVLGHFDLRRRQIKNLALLEVDRFLSGKIRSALAFLHRVVDDAIGVGNRSKPASFVAGLASGLSSCLLPLTAGDHGLLLQAIGRGRLRAVEAIHLENAVELFHFLTRLFQLSFKFLDVIQNFLGKLVPYVFGGRGRLRLRSFSIFLAQSSEE